MVEAPLDTEIIMYIPAALIFSRHLQSMYCFVFTPHAPMLGPGLLYFLGHLYPPVTKNIVVHELHSILHRVNV